VLESYNIVQECMEKSLLKQTVQKKVMGFFERSKEASFLTLVVCNMTAFMACHCNEYIFVAHVTSLC
jgi:hypothetical protein